MTTPCLNFKMQFYGLAILSQGYLSDQKMFRTTPFGALQKRVILLLIFGLD